MFKGNQNQRNLSTLVLAIVGFTFVLSACGGDGGESGNDNIASITTTTSVTSTTQPYDRDLYKHWIDEDGDCQDTRQEVLIEESQIPVTFKTGQKCSVESGQWYDPFTDEVFIDPSDLDIDHVVPLKEAHISGAHLWDSDEKERYANDLEYAEHLMAVSLSANRSKGSRDPAQWLPPNEAHHEEYAEIWIQIKKNWNLSFDEAEMEALKKILGNNISF